MERKELADKARALIESIEGERNLVKGHVAASEFLRVYSGERSSFFQMIQRIDPLIDPGSRTGGFQMSRVVYVLQGFLDYVEAGLHQQITPERAAQLEIVSDFLEQARGLLDSREVHPAAPAVLVGATLEEFLRTWSEIESLSLGSRKVGLDAYTSVLREANLITKQDAKDITAWGGIRNHAAHGEWDEVTDRGRIRLMLEGVGHFMRRYDHQD
jgi:hypothetical protein